MELVTIFYVDVSYAIKKHILCTSVVC